MLHAGHTFCHVRHFVLAHGLECFPLERTLGLWIDAEEVEVRPNEGNDAGEDGEDLSGGHGEY